MTRTTIFWRRTDLAGLERMTLTATADGSVASGTVLATEDGGFRLDYRWTLSPDWRTRALQVDRHGEGASVRLILTRTAGGWAVDGMPRPDLDGCEEPDLSVTPFCNTLPIRRLLAEGCATLVLDVCYVDGATMDVTHQRQRYDRLGEGRVRYIDLGRFTGFEADLDIDAEGFVVRYESLFERCDPRG